MDRMDSTNIDTAYDAAFMSCVPAFNAIGCRACRGRDRLTCEFPRIYYISDDDMSVTIRNYKGGGKCVFIVEASGKIAEVDPSCIQAVWSSRDLVIRPGKLRWEVTPSVSEFTYVLGRIFQVIAATRCDETRAPCLFNIFSEPWLCTLSEAERVVRDAREALCVINSLALALGLKSDMTSQRIHQGLVQVRISDNRGELKYIFYISTNLRNTNKTLKFYAPTVNIGFGSDRLLTAFSDLLIDVENGRRGNIEVLKSLKIPLSITSDKSPGVGVGESPIYPGIVIFKSEHDKLVYDYANADAG